MKKSLWVIKRILCAFLLVSISMTSFSLPVNAYEGTDDEISLMSEDDDDEGGDDEDLGDEEDSVTYYSFSFDTTLLELDLEASNGIELVNGKYCVASDDDGFSAKFNFRSSYRVVDSKTTLVMTSGKKTYNYKNTDDEEENGFLAETDDETDTFSVSLDYPVNKDEIPIVGNIKINTVKTYDAKAVSEYKISYTGKVNLKQNAPTEGISYFPDNGCYVTRGASEITATFSVDQYYVPEKIDIPEEDDGGDDNELEEFLDEGDDMASDNYNVSVIIGDNKLDYETLNISYDADMNEMTVNFSLFPDDEGDDEEDPGDGEEDPGDGEEDPGDGEENPGDDEEDPGDEDPGDEEAPGDDEDPVDDEDDYSDWKLPGNVVINISTVQKHAFSFSGKCGKNSVMSIYTPEKDDDEDDDDEDDEDDGDNWTEEDEEVSDFEENNLRSLLYKDGKYYFGYNVDSIDQQFIINRGYTLDPSTDISKSVKVTINGTAIHCSVDNDEDDKENNKANEKDEYSDSFTVKYDYGTRILSVCIPTSVVMEEEKITGDIVLSVTCVSAKSPYTVSWDTSMMSVDYSDPDEMEGLIPDGGKYYIDKTAEDISISFKVKSGYYIDNEKVKFTYNGASYEDVFMIYDEEDRTFFVSMTIPTDKKGKKILGNFVIKPQFEKLKTVTFDCDYATIEDIWVDNYDDISKKKNTTKVRGGDTIEFKIYTKEYFVLKSVKVGSKVLSEDKYGSYSLQITGDTTISITTEKFKKDIYEPVPVTFMINSKRIASLPDWITVDGGLTYNKSEKRYYTNKTKTGKYSDILLKLKLKSSDVLNDAFYSFGDYEYVAVLYRDLYEGYYIVDCQGRYIERAIKDGQPITVDIWMNKKKVDITFNKVSDITYYKYFRDTKQTSFIGDVVSIYENRDFCFVLDKRMLELDKKKLISITCDGKKVRPIRDGDVIYYMLKNVTKDCVIDAIVKPLSDPTPPDEPYDPENPEDPEDPEDPEQPEEKEFYTINISADKGIENVRAKALGKYFDNFSYESGVYSYDVPNGQKITLLFDTKDKYSIQSVVNDKKKKLNVKGGKTTFTASSDMNITVTTTAGTYLHYVKTSDKDSKDMCLTKKEIVKASLEDKYELYVENDDELLSVKKLKITGISKDCGFAAISADGKKVIISCDKADGTGKNISVSITAEGQKAAKTLVFNVYQKVTKLEVKGFKNGAANQISGSSASYKVKLNKGCDCSKLTVELLKNSDKNASVSYDPVSSLLTIETFKEGKKGYTLSTKPVIFAFTDDKGNAVGGEYAVTPMPVKMGTPKVKVVDITDTDASVEITRPKGTEGIKNLYYTVSLKKLNDKEREVEDGGNLFKDYARYFPAEAATTTTEETVLLRPMLQYSKTDYELEVTAAQFISPVGAYDLVSYNNSYSYARAKKVKFSSKAPCYEKKLKLKAVNKSFYHGKKDIALATPVFSKKTTRYGIEKIEMTGVTEGDTYRSSDKNSILTYDAKQKSILLTDSTKLYPGKYILSVYPEGGSAPAKLSFTVLAPLTDIELECSVEEISKAYNKPASLKINAKCISRINGKEYVSSSSKVAYSITSDNPELLKAVKISKGKLTVAKDYTICPEAKDNTFTLTVYSPDFVDAKGKAISTGKTIVVK